MSDGMRRRDFLKVLGVSGAGASVVGCSTDQVERLIPYVVPPDDITPGVATWYASVCQECPSGCGVWVRTREGRAVKLEGNPNHPVSQGALCSRGHSGLQGLYNPDRIRTPMLRDGEALRSVTWEEAEAMLAERVGAAGAGGLLFLGGRAGPSFSEVIENFVSAAGGTRVEHESFSEAPLREATRIAFGQNGVPTFDFGAARFVLSFGAEFLETWLSPVENARGFAAMSGISDGGPGPEGPGGPGTKGRFVILSPRLSLTGQNADEWVPIRAGSEGVVALAMANVIARGGGNAGPYAALLQAYDPRSAAEASGVPAEVIVELAERFAAEGPGLAVGPGIGGQHRNATAANLAVLVLNAVAGNVGRTVHVQRPNLGAASRPFSGMEEAIARMASGAVQVAMVHGTNPAYTLPPASGFADAFRAVPFKVAFADAMDETAALADLVLPERHYLEGWGDSNPRPGVYALQQPAMQPVPYFDSRQAADVLLALTAGLGQDPGGADFQEFLRGRWQQIHQLAGGEGDFESFWRNALRVGVVEVPAEEAGAPALRAPDTALSFDPPVLEGEEEGLALIVYPSPRLGDGKFANRPWLQELPDPVSKITWHSWIEVHPATASRMGLREGDMVRVSSPRGEVELPVWPYPGIREDTVAIATGGGHEEYGRFGTGHGVNPMVLLPAVAERPSGSMVRLATRVTLSPTGERRRLASIAGSDVQSNRPITPAVAFDELGELPPPDGAGERIPSGQAPQTGPDAPRDDHHGELGELQRLGGFAPVITEGRPEDYPLPGARYGEYDPEHQPRWAMAIDLDKCTGCSACVTACQAENNVPWVGEQQVMMGREMHWMRIERFYETVDASHAGPVDIRFLPMLCQHCGNAPCEPVCPVYAAYHTPDGLNAQVYNRCVGTRYCANNCPYKVRVFNWYTLTDVPEPLNWQYNPDVTVRENGVMEKCTFCVQRIRDAQNRAVVEGRPLRTDEVTTACQQSCPAEAIVFGDIRDPDSRVSQVTHNERTYRVLDELINTQPAVSYLKKVTFHEVESGAHG